ncbi:MAG: hypothetical protein ACREGD_00170 [Candidatus Saccharimonadales bacterium]
MRIAGNFVVAQFAYAKIRKYIPEDADPGLGSIGESSVEVEQVNIVVFYKDLTIITRPSAASLPSDSYASLAATVTDGPIVVAMWMDFM